MRVISDIAGWRAVRRDLPPKASVGFVPTMGALHPGHASLLERARRENDVVVLSIFVNPAQFNDSKDLDLYPRTLAEDLALAAPLADFVLCPAASEMYPDEYRFRVTESELSRRWEGQHRPGHFDGVLTVVLKLFNLVVPTRAYFGEKDWQQLQLVRQMVRALLLPITVVACPTVREGDGLAMSSRNRRLSPSARQKAPEFARILRTAPSPQRAVIELDAAGFRVDYVDDVDGVRLGAVRIEHVRLIDHVRL